MQIRDRIKELRRVPASSLRPSPKNWRTHPKSQQDALRGVLAEIGYADALLCRELPDDSLELIDGHLRAETTPESIVPVLVLDVNEEEAGKILATLDPLAAMAEADKDKLDALLKEVNTSSEALEAMLADLAKSNSIEPAMPEPGAGGDDFDTTPEESGPTRVQRGELWVIGGKHRLLCGDSTNAEDVARVMGGETPFLMVTDPPYGVKLDQSWRDRAGMNTMGESVKGGMHYLGGKVVKSDPSGAAFTSLDVKSDWSDSYELVPSLGVAYVWHASKHALEVENGMRRIGFEPVQQIIWNKPVLTLGRQNYHWKHEPCFYMRRIGVKVPWYGPTNATTVWDFPSPKQIFSKSDEEKEDHPCQKPLAIMSMPIEYHTKEDDVVFEPFLGSGTTLIAAHRLNRRCYGLEIEPRYCDVILKRAEAEGLTVERA